MGEALGIGGYGVAYIAKSKSNDRIVLKRITDPFSSLDVASSTLREILALRLVDLDASLSILTAIHQGN